MNILPSQLRPERKKMKSKRWDFMGSAEGFCCRLEGFKCCLSRRNPARKPPGMYPKPVVNHGTRLSTNGLAGFLNRQQCVRCSLWKGSSKASQVAGNKGGSFLHILIVTPIISHQESEAEEPRQWLRVSHEWVGDEVIILWFGFRYLLMWGF